SRVVAERLALEGGCHFGPSFYRGLVEGGADYSPEVFFARGGRCVLFVSARDDLDVIYVPIGMGSGICGLITVRDLLGSRTEIVGVVAANAPAFALSFESGRPVSTKTARTFADGMACREPLQEPVEIIRRGAARVVSVTEDEIAEAVRDLYTDTHNVAEGAGASPL